MKKAPQRLSEEDGGIWLGAPRGFERGGTSIALKFHEK